jgi:peptidoglycan/LPS O-acetylase OafA/YrhL
MQTSFHRLRFIDVWRAIAVSAVIVGHLDRNESFKATVETYSMGFLFGWGSLGVLIFFFISGYVVCLACLKEIERDTFSVKRFYTKRLFRIAPPLILYAVTCLVLGNIGLKVITFSPREFLATMVYACNLEITIFNCGWFGGHTWSLAFEEQFYLIFPFILTYRIVLARIAVRACALIFLALVVAAMPLFFPKPWVGHAGFFLIYGLFLSGALCAKHNERLSQALMRMPKVFFISGLVSTGLLYKYGSPQMQLALVATVPMMILASGHKSVIRRFMFDSGKLAYIGKISYSLYLWQQLITSNGFYIQSFLGQIAVLAALIAMCSISFEFFERPLVVLGNRISIKK